MTGLGQKRRFDNRPITSGLPPTSDIADSASHVGFVPVSEVRDRTNLVRLSSSSDGFADRRLQAKCGRTHERAAVEPLRVSPLEDLVSYLGVEGMAEEWWSTISQRSPFLT